MLYKCQKGEYLEYVNAKGENFSAESLFLILILEQQKMVNELIETMSDKADANNRDY
jgi:hypothetical protein